MRLTLRTLLAYLDDTLPPAEAREIGHKVAENAQARELVERIKRVTRRRGLSTPPIGLHGTPDDPNDPNTVAEYLGDTLSGDQLAQFEKICLDSDVHLAEVAACHQILTLVLSEQIRVPPTARQRMYQLVKGPESVPNRRPGKTIPVGGVIRDQGPIDPDDEEAGLLLGMPAYRGGEPAGRRAFRAAAVGGLLLLLLVSLYFTWPRTERPVGPGVEPIAVAGGPEVEPVRSGLEVVAAPRPASTAPAVEPTPDKTGEKKTPPTTTEPDKTEKKDLVPAAPAPRADRVAIGSLEKTTGVTPIVVRKPPVPDALWGRVMPQVPILFSSDRLTALPGYKAPLRLETGVEVELWANLPDLVPTGLLDSSITPWLPPDGFDADLTLHTGRIYLTNRKTGPARVRVRFLEEVWDLTLPEPKTEVIVELSHALVPGALPEPPRSTAGVAVLNGTVTVQQRYGEPATLARGDDLAWDSKAGRAEVRAAGSLDARSKADRAAYLARVPVFPDAARAKVTIQALDDFSQALTDPSRVRATFVEALQDKPATEQTRAAARVAVLTFAALGDLTGLGDALTDQNRPLVRQTAAEGLRFLFAAEPVMADELHKVLVEKYQVRESEADAVIQLVRGYEEADRKKPETLDRLVEWLSANTVALRELAFLNLAGMVDPADRSNNRLFTYDAGAPPEFRDPVAQEWRTKVKELKAKFAVEVAPPPVKK